jgi:hypothetical protein
MGFCSGHIVGFSGFLDLRGLSLVVLGLRFTGLFFGGYSFLSGGLETLHWNFKRLYSTYVLLKNKG